MTLCIILLLILQALLLEANPQDLCRTNNGGCEQICLIVNEREQCACLPGYVLSTDRIHCFDLSKSRSNLKCNVDNGGCEFFCQTVGNNVVCRCPHWHYLSTDGKSCIRGSPRDLCSISNGGCDHICRIRNGTVSCACRPGYGISMDGKNCFGLMPRELCSISNGGCEHFCRIRNGTVSCACRPGYVISIDGKNCFALRETACRVPNILNGEYGRYTALNFEKVTEADIIKDKEILTLRCHKGYAPFPRQNNDPREGFFEAELTCKGGIWSKGLSCLSSSCSYLPRIKTDNPSAKIIPQRNHGHVITYAFWDDSILVEKGKVVCQFGEWIGVSSELTNNCSTEDLKKYDGLKVPEDTIQKKHLEAVDVLCQIGYTPSVEFKLIICENGTWKVPHDPCIKRIGTCAPFALSPGLMSRPRIDRRGRVDERSISFSCSPPAVLEGNSYAVCLRNGTWSHSPPSCREPANCSVFHALEGLGVSYSNGVSSGSNASFNCSPPMILEGHSSALCQANGSWSNPMPTCKGSVICSEFQTPAGLQVTYSKGVSLDSIASFSCSSPMILDGNSYAVCLANGSWSHSSPTCKGARRCYLKKPEMSTLMIDPIKEHYSFGEIVDLWCPPRQKLTKKVERLMCLGTEWSDNLPDCIELNLR